MLYHTARINCLAWSPDNRLVATGSLDTCVIIYDVDKHVSNRTTIKGAHLGGVYGLAFTDENNIVSAGEDACVRVWRSVHKWCVQYLSYLFVCCLKYSTSLTCFFHFSVLYFFGRPLYVCDAKVVLVYVHVHLIYISTLFLFYVSQEMRRVKFF